MTDNSHSTIFVLLAVIILIVVIVKLYTDKRRRESLFLLSTRLNLDCFHKDIMGVTQPYQSFDRLSVGDSRRAANVMTGEFEGLKLTMFDYRYSTGSGKSRQTHHLSFAALDTQMSFTKLQIRPESFFDGVASALGFDDIDFESDEFSRAFYVKSMNKKYAYDVIHTRMMEFLLANRGWSIEMLGPSILVYNGQVLDADEFLGAAKFAREFIRQLPDYLVQKIRW